MAAQLRTKNKVFEPCKKVITPEVFQDLLEARRFAVARSAAKLHLKRLEEGQLQATQPRHRAFDTASSQDSESRHHDSQEATPMQNGRHGNGAAIAMDVDGPRAEEVRQRKRDLKDFVQRQKLEAEALKKAAAKADKEAERKVRWAAAELERSKRLLGVEREQKELADRIQAAEAEMKALQLDVEPLNEQKAKLVAQLKQVLQTEEASRANVSAPLILEEEGRLFPRMNTGLNTAAPMDTSG